MLKPDSLRALLTSALPALAVEPERLEISVQAGTLHANAAPGFAWEYRYTLRILLLDFTGGADAVCAPVLWWVGRNQPELLANPESQKRGAIAYQVDMLDDDKVDLEITLQLTERVAGRPRADGGFDIVHLGEPEDGFDDVRLWSLYVREQLIASWSAPDVPASEFDV